MIVFLSPLPDGSLQVLARAEGTDTVGDLVRVLGPKDSFLGYTQDELTALGAGQHEMEPKGDE